MNEAYKQITETHQQYSFRISLSTIILIVFFATGRISINTPNLPVYFEKIQFSIARVLGISAEEMLEKKGKAICDWDYQNRQLDDADFEYITSSNSQLEPIVLLQTEINSVYARHGMDYSENKKIPYFDFFNRFKWYKPETKDTEQVLSRFNEFEVKNIEKLAEEREKLKRL